MTSGSWTTTSGSWSTPASWGLGAGFPDAIGDVATLGVTLNATSGTRTIALGDGLTRTIGTLDMVSTASINYVLSGGGPTSTLNFDVASGRAAINVSQPAAFGALTARLLSTVNVQLSDTTNVTLTGFDTKLQIDGVISGSGGLDKQGRGTLILTGANTFNGGFLVGPSGSNIDHGRVELGTGSSLGAGAVTVSSSNTIEFLALGTMSVGNTFNQDGAGSVSLGAQTGSTLTYTGTYNINASLGSTVLYINGNSTNVTPAGTVIWQGTGGATITSGTSLNLVIVAGTLQVGNANLTAYTSIGGLTEIISGAALDLHGIGLTVSRLVGSGTVKSDTAAATLTLATTNITSFSGVIADGTGQISVVKNFASTQTLMGVNTYTGTTTINAGTLALSGSGSIAASSLIDVLSGGIFSVASVGGSTSIKNLNLQAGGILQMGGQILSITEGASSIGAGAFQGNSGTIDTVVIQATTANYSLAALQFINWESQDLIALNGTAIANTLTGSSRSDAINGGGDADIIFGGTGDDTLNGDAGADVIYGGAGADLISAANAGIPTGDGTANSLYGEDGNDTLRGSDGGDSIIGGAGNDSASGNDGNDVLSGDANDDTLDGGAGNDFLTGGAGTDTLTGGPGFDYANYLDATSGVTVSLAIATYQGVGGGLGSDALNGIEGLYGSNLGDTLTGDDAAVNAIYAWGGADSIVGNGGFDYVEAGEGDDTIDGGAGDDYLLGGNGIDTLTFASAGAAVYVDMSGAGAFANGTATGFDVLSGIERVIGSGLGDFLFGSAGADTLSGGVGIDIIYGFGLGDSLDGGGDTDYLVGGAGADTITTGAGQDYIYFQGQAEGKDTITDWRANGFDILCIDEPSFGAGLTVNQYLSEAGNANRFVVGTAATAAIGQFLWNAATSTLSWDADGTGAGAAVQLVTLTSITSLAASDILVL